MSTNLNIDSINTWINNDKKPLIISGPCSAESFDQLYATSKELKSIGIDIIRAGVWKPRTRPGTFEGNGEKALKWIKKIKKELNLKFAVEVANPNHVKLCLHYGIDILWIGARTTVNPFSVQEIAESMQGIDVPVLVKNPINPDLSLWIGALERLNKCGLKKIGAIHRGFSTPDKSKYRYAPMWKIAIDLKSSFPNLPIVCDPSHICGNREMIHDVSQKALDLGYDGLIIESHIDPENAWSDAKQQVTPISLKKIISDLKIKKKIEKNQNHKILLEDLRDSIDIVDKDLIGVLEKRFDLVKKIAEFKENQELTVFQVNRWNEIFESRKKWSTEKNLDISFVEELYKLIHIASIKSQTEILNKKS